jgi:hypothetical protein
MSLKKITGNLIHCRLSPATQRDTKRHVPLKAQVSHLEDLGSHLGLAKLFQGLMALSRPTKVTQHLIPCESLHTTYNPYGPFKA